MTVNDLVQKINEGLAAGTLLPESEIFVEQGNVTFPTRDVEIDEPGKSPRTVYDGDLGRYRPIHTINPILVIESQGSC